MRVKMRSQVDAILLLGTGVLLLVLTAALFMGDLLAGWRGYQQEFMSIVAGQFGNEAAERVPRGIQQIWVDKLGVIDRCTTCHLGIRWAGLDQHENPYKSHPRPELLDIHPVEEYGCTTCHAGQGYAVETDAAHGYTPHWEEPMLSRAIAGEYLFREASALIEMRCNECHRYERETAGMPQVNHAKRLVREKVCKACHIINGSGGRIGPDLSFEGDRHAEQLDFSNFTGFRSAFNWHVNHFKNPVAVVPGTVMPDLNFSTYDAQALAVLAMSWRKWERPLEYLPGFALEEERTAEELAAEKRLLEGEGAFFIEKGCFVCHSISSWGIISPSEKGPDLALAVEDVRTRFNKTLEEFIFEPSGTMEIILSTMIILTDNEKWEVINKLRTAYHLKQAQLARQKQ